MPKGYSHLTRDTRSQIYALKSTGFSQSHIARQLKISPSTVSREIKRNSGLKGYRFEQADRLAIHRRSQASSVRRVFTPAAQALVEDKLRQKWSPEQISGRFKREGLPSISHETIYKHIWADKHRGGDLFKHLRHGCKPYNRRKNKKAGRGLIPNRRGIEERPAAVELKRRIGDWEGDTIIGSHHQGALVSLVDRASKYTLLALLNRKTAEETANSITTVLQNEKVKTLTFDNGKEFALHELITKMLNAPVFFANPYCAWERGLNEHTNGLVRQYIPKSMSLKGISQEKVAEIEKNLNTRPRKVLNYKTPTEVFRSQSVKLCHNLYALRP